MNNIKKFKYFAPVEITVGLFNSNLDGFPTCYYMDKGWIKSSTFKRLTDGYSPSQMRDSEKQLKKFLYNKALTLDNTPIEGFKIVENIRNIYKIVKYEGDVIISDPRGFNIGIKCTDFINLIKNNSVVNGKLLGKYSYVWTNDDLHSFTLVEENSLEYKDAIECRNNFITREKIPNNCIKKKDLVIGKAYHAIKVLEGDWIYAGTHDTYSSRCHFDAFNKGGYNVQSIIEKEQSHRAYSGHYSEIKTTKNRMIFFPVKFKASFPWSIRNDISKIFQNEAPLPKRFHFESSKTHGVISTVESIEKAISNSPVFQKIDFKRFKSENQWEKLDFKIFEWFFNYDCQLDLTLCPFYKPYYLITKSNKTSRFGSSLNIDPLWLKIGLESSYTYNDLCNKHKNWYIINISQLPNRVYANNYKEKYFQCTYEEIYEKVQPIVPIMYYENGNKVQQQIVINFIPEEIKQKIN